MVTPSDRDGGAAPLTLAELIAAVVHRSPVGLTIEAGPQELFANPAAQALRTDESGAPLVDLRRQEVEVLGRTYGVTTTIDSRNYRTLIDDLTRRAFYDDLTGLPKRDLFEQTVTNMIADRCEPFALSFIDIDNFKNVNDYYGHGVGDQLLIKIVRRILDCMRPTDMLARVGGDEFMLLTTPIDVSGDPARELDELAVRFRDPFYIDGFEIFSSASIGTSFYPAHGQTFNVLRMNADCAMYRVKGDTKGALGIFDANLGHAASERMEIEQRVRLAIRDKRLLCAYQPKVDFRNDRIVGVEVLLRWQDDNGDIRAPGDIIRVATELGLMDDVALTVVDKVVAQFDQINEAFGREATISLNVAARQATDVRFMTIFAERLKSSGFASRFVVELTEETFLSKGDFQTTILPILREIGAGVSIDDFGVGYSSLSALAEITADELKVDRSFITEIHRKPRNQVILRMIELLGTALDMRIVVEGVETADELAYLMGATRIHCAQGYYFAKPMILAYDGACADDGRRRYGSERERRGTRAGGMR